MTIRKRLPSFAVIATSAWQTVRRFPFAILCGLLAAFAAMNKGPLGSFWPIAASGISAAVLGALTGEGFRRPKLMSPVLSLVSVTIASAILVPFISQEQLLWYGTLHLGVVIHLAIAVLPVRKFSVAGFWQYNLWLFVRFFFAQIFSGILCAGLMAAAGAVQFLLFPLPKEIFSDIAILVNFVFHPWFFLSALPKQLKQFDQERVYPKGLDIISRYLLVPLLGIYCVILYLYLGKITVLQSLPKGGVAYLVSGVSLLGVLTFLFLQPRLHDAGGIWIKLRKGFFIILIPLLGLLFMGMGVRLEEYGLTTNRYLIGLFSLWTLGIAVYFLLRSRPDIRLIPLTLAAIALISLGGPWSVYRLPPRLQFARLEKLLQETGALVDGKIVGKLPPDRKLGQRAASALETVISSSERRLLQPWFPELSDLANANWTRYGDSYDTEKAIHSRLGIDQGSYSTSISIESGADRVARSVHGFDYVMPLDSIWTSERQKGYPRISLRGDLVVVHWTPTEESPFSMKPWWIERSQKKLNAGVKKEIVFEAEDNRTKMRLFITYASFELPLTSFRINNLTGQALLKRK